MAVRYLCLNQPLENSNPYTKNFAKLLECENITTAFRRTWPEVIGGAGHALLRREGFVMHVHWPEHLFVGGKRWLKLILIWIAVKLLRARLVFTLHNLKPHSAGDEVDPYYRFVFRLASLIFIHDEASRPTASANARKGARIELIPHGLYDESYPLPRPKNLAASTYSISTDAPVLICLGFVRRNKGAIDAVKLVVGDPGLRCRLVVAGACEPELQREIREAAGTDERITLLFKQLDDQEFIDLINLADILLLPYRDITTSGALFAGWSFDKPVLARRLPYFVAHFPGGEDFRLGALIGFDDSIELKKAIDGCMRVNPGERALEMRAARARSDLRPHAIRIRSLISGII
jgi:glycosyltransferase involved in cell wall biosynthesis